MGTKRWTIAWTLALVAATAANGRAQTAPATESAPGTPLVPVGPTLDDANDLARAGHQKKLAGLTLMIGGGALVATGVGLTIAGFASDDPTRCHRSGGFYYYSYRGAVADDGGGVSCWNQSLVLAGGTTWLLGAVALGIGVPVYFIGRRQLRDAERVRRWFFSHGR
jgi:hypothetical protein